MKARPRRIENKVASYISDTFLYPRKVSKVERIPVLGRTGPDIDVLPIVRVAIDVKSRKANPKGYRLKSGQIRYFWGEGYYHYKGERGFLLQQQIATRLEDLELLFDIENPETDSRPGSKVVSDWLSHMDEWCDRHKPILPAVVLHWPGTPVKHSTFVIFKGDRRMLHARRKCFDDLQL